jgi:hypothetical protein
MTKVGTGKQYPEPSQEKYRRSVERAVYHFRIDLFTDSITIDPEQKVYPRNFKSWPRVLEQA